MLFGFGVVVDEVVVDGGCTPRCPPSSEPVGFGVLEGRGGYVCVGLGVVDDDELTVGLFVC